MSLPLISYGITRKASFKWSFPCRAISLPSLTVTSPMAARTVPVGKTPLSSYISFVVAFSPHTLTPLQPISCGLCGINEVVYDPDWMGNIGAAAAVNYPRCLSSWKYQLLGTSHPLVFPASGKTTYKKVGPVILKPDLQISSCRFLSSDKAVG
jgi:hypothetical protein